MTVSPVSPASRPSAFGPRSRRRVLGALASTGLIAGAGVAAAPTAFASAADDCTVANTVTSDATDQTAELQTVIDEQGILCLNGTFVLSAQLTYTADLVVYGLADAVLDGDSTTRILGQDDPDASLTVDNVTFRNGFDDDQDGGAIEGNAVTVIGSTFTNNSARDGGAIFADGPLAITASTFSANTADRFGGAVMTVFGEPVTVADSTFAANDADLAGGAIFGYGVTATGSTFVDNTALAGGAILSEGALLVSGSSFEDNSAEFSGGAVSIGAGVEQEESAAEVVNSSFVNNVAGGGEPPAGGGAIASRVNLAVDGSTFSGNTATRDGGAIWMDSDVEQQGDPGDFIDVTNSTFVDNEAGNEGGAIFHGPAEIGFSTFVGNTAAEPDEGIDLPGDALYKVGDGVATLRANIFAGTTGYPQLGVGNAVANTEYLDFDANVFTTRDNDFDLDTSLAAAESSIFEATYTEIFGTDTPQLADNGGPTPTIAIPESSVAVDLLDLSLVPASEFSAAALSTEVDQRGETRGALLDAGAYEFIPAEETDTDTGAGNEGGEAEQAELPATGPSAATGMLAALVALFLAAGAAAVGVARRAVRATR